MSTAPTSSATTASAVGPAPAPVVARVPGPQRVLVRAGFPLLGAALGVGLAAVLAPVLGFGFLPFQDALEVLRDRGLPLRGAVLGLVGLIAGVVLAAIAVREEVELESRADGVEVRVGDQAWWVPSDGLAAVCVDRRDLVVLDHRGGEPVRVRSDVTAAALRPAVEAHGHPFAEAHPHGDAFRRWVDGQAGLDTTQHALLRARAAAREHDKAREQEVLRADLVAAGVAVRDRRGRQEWRATGA